MEEAKSTGWDEEVDLLVIGAGAAGMTTALVASLEGLNVLLCEKSDMVGGITSTSAGTIWVPGTSQSEKAGVPDRVEDARRYLDSVIGNAGDSALREAFLASGREAIDDLEARSEVKFAAAAAHPDYLGNHPGAAYGGRALGALPFDGRLLGGDFDRIRPPKPEFLVLGGMMVAKADIPFLLAPFASLKALIHIGKMLLRHAIDRLHFRRGTRFVMGNALVGRLLFSLRRQKVPLRFNTALKELIREEGRVLGALLQTPDGSHRIAARRGVVLATGGIGWNQALRKELFPEAARAHSLAPSDNAGEGLEAALKAGGTLERALESAGLWMPCSILKRPDGSTSVYPHIVLDRAKPGLIAVNSAGRRFVNEANSYHDFCMGMLRSEADVPSVPAHLICDAAFLRKYGIGLIHPGARNLKSFIASGYLIEAPTLSGLAQTIGVDPKGLEHTVDRYNTQAAQGLDEEFGRGSTDLNRINGDPEIRPNPCVRPIGPGPFYAVAVYPTDLASSAGLRIDVAGRVLSNSDNHPIHGLYACGNDAASIFNGTYPGPGTTIGPALVFAWRIATRIARQNAN